MISDYILDCCGEPVGDFPQLVQWINLGFRWIACLEDGTLRKYDYEGISALTVIKEGEPE